MKIDLHLVLHLNNSCVRDTFTFQLFRDYSVISAVLMVQCVVEDGKSEHRVCIFKNIVLWEGQLLWLTVSWSMYSYASPVSTFQKVIKASL